MFQAGYTEETGVQHIDVNYNPENFVLGGTLGVDIDGFNTGDINPTNTSQIRLRLQNDGNTGYWGNIAGQANIFGQARDNGGRTLRLTGWNGRIIIVCHQHPSWSIL